MKVYHSPASPFVRKVRASAIVLGVADRLELLPCKVNIVNRDQTVVAQNPMGQVPTLIADDGTVLYDSRVICEYLDATYGPGKLFPAAGAARWQALVEQSSGDGLLDAATSGRSEVTIRPPEKQWDGWRAAQMAKISSVLDKIESWVPGLAGRFDIGPITIGAACGYLDFRYPDFDWRSGRPALTRWWDGFSALPLMSETKPHA